jgi:hypothetical protein
MAKDKKRSEWLDLFTPRTIVATAALCVSLCSMIMTILQFRSNRAVQYASVLPYVNIGIWHGSLNDEKQEGAYTMTITNDGVGPAFIEYLRIQCGDKVFDANQFYQASNWLVTGDTVPVLTNEFMSSTITRRRMLPAGQNIPWFQPNSTHDAFKFLKKKWSPYGRDNFVIICCFSDIYGNKWVFRDDDFQVTPCNTCPVLEPTQ